MEKHFGAIEALQAQGVAITPSALVRPLRLRGHQRAVEVLTAWRTWRNEAEIMQPMVDSSTSAPEPSTAEADERSMTLAQYEEVVERGFKCAWEAGEALKQIRDQRLFLRTHETFEEYVRDRFEVHRSQAYRWMQAAEVAANLLPIGDMPLPTHESQIRPLVGLSPANQVAAWQHACASAPGPVTAKIVKASVTSMFPPQREAEIASPAPAVAQNEGSEPRQLVATDPQRAINRLAKIGEQFAAWLADAVSNPANLVTATQHLLGTVNHIVGAHASLRHTGQDDVEVAIELLSKLFPAKKVEARVHLL